MSKPEPRKSSLAGTSPFVPPQAPPAATVAPSAPPAAAPTTRAPQSAAKPGGEKKNPKMNYYVDQDDAGRIRAAFLAGRDRYGWRNLTEFQLDTMMQRVAQLEAEFNDGQPFSPAGAGSVSAGRPMGE